jgi:hypothetical protein
MAAGAQASSRYIVKISAEGLTIASTLNDRETVFPSAVSVTNNLVYSPLFATARSVDKVSFLYLNINENL